MAKHVIFVDQGSINKSEADVLPHRSGHIFHIIKDDLTITFTQSPLTTIYSLQHSFQTAVKSHKVWV